MLLYAEPYFAASFQQQGAVMVSGHDATLAGATKCRKVFQDLPASGIIVFEYELIALLPVAKIRKYFVVLFLQHQEVLRSCAYRDRLLAFHVLTALVASVTEVKFTVVITGSEVSVFWTRKSTVYIFVILFTYSAAHRICPGVFEL